MSLPGKYSTEYSIQKDGASWTIWANGNCIGSADSEEYAKRIIRDLTLRGRENESKSVLGPPTGKPSTVGLLPSEIESGVPCSCGHRLVRPNMREMWYWQTHSLEGCTLILPDLVCWCGLKRSEHIDGHQWKEV